MDYTKSTNRKTELYLKQKKTFYFLHLKNINTTSKISTFNITETRIRFTTAANVV